MRFEECLAPPGAEARRSRESPELLVRTSSLVLSSIVFLGAAGPSAGAQGPPAIASTRVTVIVPEHPRSSSRPSRSTGISASPSLRSAAAEPTGHSDRTICAGSLDLGAIGRASVSCLETAELAGHAGGASIELEAEGLEPGARDELMTLEFIVDGGAVIRLPLRSYDRGGHPIRRATVPAVAFQRIAAARRLSVRVSGTSSEVSDGVRAALRRLAAAMSGASVHQERARH